MSGMEYDNWEDNVPQDDSRGERGMSEPKLSDILYDVLDDGPEDSAIIVKAKALEEQDEVHWKTRRTLLTKLERMGHDLDDALEWIMAVINWEMPISDGVEMLRKHGKMAAQDDLASLPTQQKPTEEAMEKA